MTYQNVIEDGYTEPFFIKEIPGIHSDVRGKQRPMLHQERYVIDERLRSVKSTEQSRVMIESIVRHVAEWDLKDRSGEPVKITYDSAKVLKNLLIERLYRIVLGVDAGDEDPERPFTSSQVSSEYEALLEGANATIKQAERDEGN